jgi:broad specificity phosphatase PhoE
LRKLHLVRHSLPVIDEAQPASTWRLSPAGSRLAVLVAERLANADVDAVFAGTEPKVEETGRIIADRLGAPFTSAEGLVEHRRDSAGWLGDEDFRAAVARLFAEPGKRVFGEETANEAHGRFQAALDRAVGKESGNLAVVAGGTVISLFVARANSLDAVELWRKLGLPALVTVEWPSGRLLELIERF